jgi:hypothetical protein
MGTTKEACFHSVVDTKFSNSTHSQAKNEGNENKARTLPASVMRACLSGMRMLDQPVGGADRASPPTSPGLYQEVVVEGEEE